METPPNAPLGGLYSKRAKANQSQEEKPMNVQPTNDKVDGIFEYYTLPGLPGCALVVMKDGAIVYQQGYGLANLEHSVPITPATVFNIGSMAKQFTAFAIALLEGEGKLALDDDIRRHL